jgi:hypothetical protein
MEHRAPRAHSGHVLHGEPVAYASAEREQVALVEPPSRWGRGLVAGSLPAAGRTTSSWSDLEVWLRRPLWMTFLRTALPGGTTVVFDCWTRRSPAFHPHLRRTPTFDQKAMKTSTASRAITRIRSWYRQLAGDRRATSSSLDPLTPGTFWEHRALTLAPASSSSPARPLGIARTRRPRASTAATFWRTAVAVEADRVATLRCHPGLPLVLNVRSPP